MRLRCAGALLLSCGLLPEGVAHAAELTVSNDSTLNGVPSTVANFFIPGEEAAAWLTSPCNGDVVAAQIYWTSMFGGNPARIGKSVTGRFSVSL